jgi:phospholipid transport system substrate-binding protein
MLTRRTFLISTLATAAMLATVRFAPPAWAQATGAASAFVQKAGDELIAVVNGTAPRAQQQEQLQQIIDRVVDVDAVARFCLGRFWRAATPDQQKQYLALFHQVLLKNITGKLGDYRGVTFTMGRSVPREEGVGVATIVSRPNNPPTDVEWLVSTASGSPKIVDVIAEGTSLRLTQRNDYSSYLSRNNSSVQALLDAMRQQLTQAG